MTAAPAAELARAEAAFAAGRLAEAEAACRTILAARPGEAGALALFGRIAQRVERHDVAVQVLSAAAAAAPAAPDLLMALASSQGRLGRIRATFESCRRVLALAPDHDDARLSLMRTLEYALLRDPALAGDGPARRPPGPPAGPRFSVVICSISPDKFAAATASYRAALGDDLDIVGIHDARSLCEGYNRGIARARGELLILSHDDVEVLAHDFEARLRRHLARFDLVGVAGTTLQAGASWFHSGVPHQHGFVPHRRPGEALFRAEAYGVGAAAVAGIQSLDGLFLAGPRALFAALGFDADRFDDFHLYDTDFSYRAHRAGHRLAVATDLCLLHQSTGARGAAFEAWRTQAARFLEKHAATLPDRPKGPNPLRAIHLATRDQLRAYNAALLELAAGGEPAVRWPG